MERKKHLKTIFSLSLVLIIFFFVFNSIVLLFISIGIALSGILSKFLAEKIFITWNYFSKFTSFIISNILLSLIFYLILTPLSFFFRLTGKDPMKKKWKSKNSLFVNRNHEFTAEDLQNLW